MFNSNIKTKSSQQILQISYMNVWSEVALVWGFCDFGDFGGGKMTGGEMTMGRNDRNSFMYVELLF